MPDEIKLTMDAPVPQPVKEEEISTLDESVLSPEERKVVDDFAQKIDLTNSTLVLQ